MIILHSKITSIRPETKHVYVSGSGDKTIYEDQQIGFRVQIGLMSFVVEEQPNFTEGEKVALIIVKD